MVDYRRLGLALIHYGFITPLTALAVFFLLLTIAGPSFDPRRLFLPVLLMGALLAFIFRQAASDVNPYSALRETLLVVLSIVGLTSLMGLLGIGLYLASDEKQSSTDE